MVRMLGRRRRLTGRSALLAALVILLLGAVISLTVIFFIDRGRSRQTSEAPAEIVSEQHVTWTERTGSGNNRRTRRKEGYNVSYRYTIGFDAYEAKSERNTEYKPGRAYKVCYNPGSPRDHDLRDTGFKCGDTILFP